jgi:hypothetical protein
LVELEDGSIGIFTRPQGEKGGRHYYPMVFSLNPKTGIELIARCSRFLPGPAKRTDLVDVVFSGGLIRNKDQASADLYAGISDTEAHRITIPDPFIKFEKLGACLNESLSL